MPSARSWRSATSRRVVLISGNSSFLFHISELETAVRKNLPIVCIVGCDYAWGLEVAVYKGEFRSCNRRRPKPIGARQLRLDKIAEGFGAYGEFVGSCRRHRPRGQARPRLPAVPPWCKFAIDELANATEVPGFDEFASWYGDAGY